MTGAQVVTDDKNNGVNIVFGKQVGKAGQKLTHLVINYNEGTDLYDLKALKMNKKTFCFSSVKSLDGLFGDQIKSICEDLTGLYFSF